MNKERFLKVADVIEQNPERFDLEYFFRERRCGTTACVAGWATILYCEEKGILNYIDQIAYSVGAEYLDITGEQANRLFYGDIGSVWIGYAKEFGVELDTEYDGKQSIHGDVPAAMAVKVLRDIANGETEL